MKEINYKFILEKCLYRYLLIFVLNIPIFYYCFKNLDNKIDYSLVLTILSILFSFFIGFIFALYSNEKINNYILESNPKKNILYDVLESIKEESILFVISILSIYILSVFNSTNKFVFSSVYNIVIYNLLIIIYNICLFFNLYKNQYSKRIKYLNKDR